MAGKPKWTSGAVIDALRAAYGIDRDVLSAEEWALLTEVPLRTSHDPSRSASYWNTNQRTIDVMMVRNWGGGDGFWRVAFEVKVSRSDYRNETDAKRAPAEASAHQCYYLTPAGLIRPEELPVGWGLMEVHADERSYAGARGWPVGDPLRGALVKTRVRAFKRTPSCDLDYLVSAFARRASRAEERIRRGEEDAAKVPALQREVESLSLKVQRRDEAIGRERTRARQAVTQMIATQGPQECADCREPVAYKPAKSVWEHTSAPQEATCHEQRTEKDRLRREEATGARYQWGFAGPVEPLSIRQALDAPP